MGAGLGRVGGNKTLVQAELGWGRVAESEGQGEQGKR